MRLILRDEIDGLRGDPSGFPNSLWQTACGICVTIWVSGVTSDAKDTWGVSAKSWETVFAWVSGITLLVCVGFFLRFMVARRRRPTRDEVVEKIIGEVRCAWGGWSGDGGGQRGQ